MIINCELQEVQKVKKKFKIITCFLRSTKQTALNLLLNSAIIGNHDVHTADWHKLSSFIFACKIVM